MFVTKFSFVNRVCIFSYLLRCVFLGVLRPSPLAKTLQKKESSCALLNNREISNNLYVNIFVVILAIVASGMKFRRYLFKLA